ncbi:MAG: class I SAM-dependent methyltransferase [Elainellaceae cyanobacterium]
MNDDSNQSVYAASSIVRHYARLNRLQPAEQLILERFRDRLPSMTMLDIGVGGGRTTQHFAPLVGRYVGIDYSAEMVAACRLRCPKAVLNVGDARAMPQFADSSFDFILFSFNGIDSVSHSDRLKILQEVHRIGRPGGIFLFSSHNLQNMARAFKYQTHVSLNPVRTYVDLAMFGLLRLFNRGVSREQLQTADYLTLKDESHNFRLQTYYIRPRAQIEQLQFGFEAIETYSWMRGLISGADRLALQNEEWLYYLCTVGAKPGK